LKRPSAICAKAPDATQQNSAKKAAQFLGRTAEQVEVDGAVGKRIVSRGLIRLVASWLSPMAVLDQRLMLRFTKMNGAGNDFVMLDNRAGDLKLTAAQVIHLCDRHRGVGADGVLLLEKATNGADFRMRYYNADGGEVEMCGNGARCFARFANRVAGAPSSVSFETPAGVIAASLEGELVRLQMSDPKDLQLDVPLRLDHLGTMGVSFVNSGVPHVVVRVHDIDAVDVRKFGKLIRYDPLFAPKGTNANFVERRGDRSIAIRTYERGVEDETLACGTGVVASALVFAATEPTASPVTVRVRGGNDLQVGFDKTADGFRNVTLTGPADFVFEGTIEV
jgi:diaminopimelate epimerase